MPRALLLDELRAGWLDQAEAPACLAVVTHHPLMDVGTVARLHDAGLRALVYTANDRAEAQRLITLGMDGIISDAVDVFMRGSNA